MSKYDSYVTEEASLPNPLVAGETLIWSGKPKRLAFVLNRSLTMLPVALLWILFDGFFLMNFFDSGIGSMAVVIIPFFLFHLMPVWIWLYHVLSASRCWKNTKYYVTDRRLIIQSGFVNADITGIYYKDIRNVNLKIGLVDKILGVGDITFDLGEMSAPSRRRRGMGTAPIRAFLDLEDPHSVYPLVQKTVLDMQTDIEYPNAYRPDYNPGYNTRYRP